MRTWIEAAYIRTLLEINKGRVVCGKPTFATWQEYERYLFEARKAAQMQEATS